MGDQAGQLADKRLFRQLDGFIEPCGHALGLFFVQRRIEMFEVGRDPFPPCRSGPINTA
jgi:hypothetical protein